MPDQNNEELIERLHRLEKKVEELEHRLDSKSDPSDFEESFSSSTAHKPKKAAAEKKIQSFVDNVQFGERWLNRMGIGLLLIGVAFLFKYSIDQGWLVPPIRSAIGLGIGLFLFGSGVRMSERMNPFRQIMLGGGIAVFYITGFATYQLYNFLPGAVIWTFMIVVTLLALSLALREDEPVLSVTGTLGALGTPFMLYSGSGSVIMLMVYVALILTAGAIIYVRKGWMSLLWSMLAGGVGVLLVGVFSSLFRNQPLSVTEQWMLQGGMLVWMLATWGAAVWRQNTIRSQGPAVTVHLSVFWVPLWLLLLMEIHWKLTVDQAALLSFSLAATGGGGYFILNRRGSGPLAFSHGFMGLIMVTIAAVLFFEGTLLYTILAAEAVIVRYVTARTGDIKLNISAHILFFIVLYWTFSGLQISVNPENPLLNIDSITQLAFIVLGGLLIPQWLSRDNFRLLYRIVSHLMLLFWLYQVFSELSNGQAWVTAVWGIYAIGLIVAGFTRYGNQVRVTGMLTIFLTVGKLFLVDLAQLQALWRILLFTGLGGALMLLGYYLQSVYNLDYS